MRRRRQSKVEVTMFPFLSVLCTVIGVLMLFILLIVSSRVVQSDEQPEPVIVYPVPPPPPVPGPREEGVTEDEYQRLEEQIDTLGDVLLAKQQELESTKQLITKLEDLIAAKEDEQLVPERGDGRILGVQVDTKEKVIMEPGENIRVTKRPRFIEIMADGFRTQPEKVFYATGEIRQRTSTPLKRFLAKVYKNRRKEYLLFLVHPNGIANFDQMLEYVTKTFVEKKDKKERIDIGWEPFSEEWLFVSQQLEEMRNSDQRPDEDSDAKSEEASDGDSQKRKDD